MTHEDLARRLVDHLEVVVEEARNSDKRRAATMENLSAQELRVLRMLGRESRCIMSGLAKSICLSLSSVTGLIDRLVEKGLVRRDRSPDDRRVVQVVLTDEGRELHEANLSDSVEFARALLKGLSVSEQEELVRLFGKISERLASEARVA